MNRGSDVESAMANATRAFGAGTPSHNQTNFIQQRQQQTSASPAPHGQGQYQQYAQGNGQHAAAQGTPTSQRVNYGSYNQNQAQQRQPVPGASMAHRPSDVMTLGPAANSAIPLEVREKLQTNDQGEVLFFSQPPQPQVPESKIPSELRTSLRYRVERMRQRLLDRQEAEKADGEAVGDAPKINGLSSNNGENSKRSSDDNAGTVAKRPRTEGKPLWLTNPITLADIDLKDPESSIDAIDQGRVDPATDVLYFRQWGVGYKDFLKSACLRNLQLWSGLAAEDQLAGIMEESIKGVAASVERTVVNEVVQKVDEAKANEEYFWKRRAEMNKQPEFYLEDRDSLYCGLSWQGPNPYPFNGGTGVNRRD